jgi:hypothetical protein
MTGTAAPATGATWDEPETEQRPTPEPVTTSKTPKPAARAPSPQNPPSNPSGAGVLPEAASEAPKRRGRPPADPSKASEPKVAVPAKEIADMSLAELTKELAKAAAKAKAGHEALARIEELNGAIQTRLG